MNAPSTRRSLAWAVAAAAVIAAFVSVVVPLRGLPLSFVKLLAGGDLTAMEYHGGVRISVRVTDEQASPETIARAADLIAHRAGSFAEVGSIQITGRAIELDLVAGSADGAYQLASNLVSRGDLTFHRVVSDSAVMRALYTDAERHSPPGAVRGAIDYWHHETEGKHTDYYVASDSLGHLTDYLEAAGNRSPSLAPEPEHMIALEYVSRPSYGGPEQPFWRTYYLEKQPYLTTGDVENAYVYWDPMTNRPALLVEFTADGERRFGEFTANNVGDKLAIAFDGEVMSAPVIQSAIRGGSSTITLGAGTPEAMQNEANSLASVFNRGSRLDGVMPLTIEVRDVTQVSARVSGDDLRNAGVLFAFAMGLLGFVVVFVAARVTPAAEPAVARGHDQSSPAHAFVRLMVTIAAGVAVYVSPHLLLPTIDKGNVVGLMLPGTTYGADYVVGDQFGIFALGIMPIVAAFLVVEIAALIVPAWRPLRIGGPGGRARLGRATAVVTAILAFVQGYFVATWLARVNTSGFPDSLELFRSGVANPVFTTAITLAAGVMVYWLLATLVSRYGLGNGISVIILASALSAAVHAFEILERVELDAASAAWFVAAVTIPMVMTAAILRVRIGGKTGVCLPTAGIVPIAGSTAFMAVVTTMMWADIQVPIAWLIGLDPQATNIPVVMFTALIALSVVLSWLFSRPRVLSSSRARVVGHSRGLSSLWLAILLSTIYLIAITALYLVSAERPSTILFELITPIVVTAIAMDLLAEWRAFRRRGDLVSVWPLHRVQLVDLVVSALQGAGIDVHVRGRYHRTLFYFFAPFIPIEIMVPRDRADDAREALQSLLASDQPDS